jgi:biotin carboxylase
MSQYLLVIEYAPRSLFETLATLRRRPEYANLELAILTTKPKRYRNKEVRILPCTFASESEIRQALQPVLSDLRGVICRNDKNIQYLRQAVPLLPPQIRVASPEALHASTNKQLMRRAFVEHAPEITPQFLAVHDASPPTLQSIEERLSFPVIIKPTDLASSLLVQTAETPEALADVLQHVMTQIHDLYQREKRLAPPQIIVEEYMEGDFYSIDAYVMESDYVFFCPPVGYVPAKQIGVDDFSPYKRFVPTTLGKQQVAEAEQAVAKAIKAVGLTHSSVLVELVLTKDGWKVIELGPRLGRFRHALYGAGYGIDHSLNDALIHLGHRPAIPASLKKYAAAYSVYPEREGTLREITHLETLRQHPLVSDFKVFAQPGDQARHAKNGGHALAEFMISSEDQQAFDKAVTFVENAVKSVID